MRALRYQRRAWGRAEAEGAGPVEKVQGAVGTASWQLEAGERPRMELQIQG